MPRKGLRSKLGQNRLRSRASRGPRGLPKRQRDRSPIVVDGKKLNADEAEVYRALVTLKEDFEVQVPLGGGNVLGGLSCDFLLRGRGIDLEVHGFAHDTDKGRERDFWRNVAAAEHGLRRVAIYTNELGEGRTIPRLLEIIGFPVTASVTSAPSA